MSIDESEATRLKTIEISDETYEIAKRIAAFDGIDVRILVENIVLRHSEYIDMFLKASANETPSISNRLEE